MLFSVHMIAVFMINPKLVGLVLCREYKRIHTELLKRVHALQIHVLVY
jgi:hypothetical protein